MCSLNVEYPSTANLPPSLHLYSPIPSLPSPLANSFFPFSLSLVLFHLVQFPSGDGEHLSSGTASLGYSHSAWPPLFPFPSSHSVNAYLFLYRVYTSRYTCKLSHFCYLYFKRSTSITGLLFGHIDIFVYNWRVYRPGFHAT